MPHLDGTDPDDYRFAASLDSAQWAWEFLRRNPRYRSEWDSFYRTWQALEAAYGKPPNRDFCAWKADHRAWVPASECEDGECRVDQDKVLIECALGARWGFYKFPPNPRDDDPVGGQRLSWRQQSRDAVLVSSDDTAWLGEDPARVALGFDLSLPLRDQIELAKRALQVVQRQRQRSGEVCKLSIRTEVPQMILMLRLLDAESANIDVHGLTRISPEWEGLMHQGRRLRDGAYLRLLTLPT